MSLIYEALKKAQESKGSANGKGFDKKTVVEQNRRALNPVFFYSILIGGTLLGACLILLIISLVHKPHSQPIVDSRQQAKKMMIRDMVNEHGKSVLPGRESPRDQSDDLLEDNQEKQFDQEFESGSFVNEQRGQAIASFKKDVDTGTPEAYSSGAINQSSKPVFKNSEEKVLTKAAGKKNNNKKNGLGVVSSFLPGHSIDAYLKNMEITSIKFAGEDSKVLIDNRVYRIGSVVDFDQSLKLVEISPDALVFEDKKGARYRRELK